MIRILLAFTVLLASTANAQHKDASKKDSAVIRKTLTDFYKWYNTAWKKVDSFDLYKSKKKNDGPPYVIDWKEVEKYFAYLRKKAPGIGNTFIQNERAFFKQAEQNFKDYPEEEIPMGFDYDRFTNTQEEPSWFWKALSKKSNRWAITIDGKDPTKAYVVVYAVQKDGTTVGSLVFCCEMQKEQGKWKIGLLSCEIEKEEMIEEKAPVEN